MAANNQYDLKLPVTDPWYRVTCKVCGEYRDVHVNEDRKIVEFIFKQFRKLHDKTHKEPIHDATPVARR